MWDYEQIEGMHQMLDMLTDVLRQPLSDAMEAYADDLLREAICRSRRFRAGLESIALEGLDSWEGYGALLRVARLMERLEMLQQRHREWGNAPEAPAEASLAAGSVGHPEALGHPGAGSLGLPGAAQASLAAGSVGHPGAVEVSLAAGSVGHPGAAEASLAAGRGGGSGGSLEAWEALGGSLEAP